MYTAVTWTGYERSEDAIGIHDRHDAPNVRLIGWWRARRERLTACAGGRGCHDQHEGAERTKTTTPGGRTRIARFTPRGRAAYARIHDILRDVEAEWKTELGARDFSRLKALLLQVWESPLVRSGAPGPSKPARVT